MILDLLYPIRCPVCGKIRPYGGAYVCSSCEKELSYVSQPVCMRCGKELDSGERWNGKEYCADCLRQQRDFSGGIALLNYNDAAKKIMAKLKYQNKREYAAFLADEMAKRHGRQILRLAPELLVPVPVHQTRRRERGYNQAELLAEKLGRRLGIPVKKGWLIRIENTKAQKQLGYNERQRNEKKAFGIVAGRHTDGIKTVMLVDDIYTTGATAQACTDVLLEAGVQKVYLISMAIGYGR